MDTHKYIDVYSIEIYRCLQESEQHWQLRRQFLYDNQARYPETELVYLSQVFANIEIVGYRYNDEMMDEIEEMSEGLVRKSVGDSSHAYSSQYNMEWGSGGWGNDQYGDSYFGQYGGYPSNTPSLPSDIYNIQDATTAQQYMSYNSPSDYQPLTPERLQRIRNIISQSKCIETTNIFLNLDTCMSQRGLSYTYDLEKCSDHTYICSVFTNSVLVSCVKGPKKYKTRSDAFEQAISSVNKSGPGRMMSYYPMMGDPYSNQSNMLSKRFPNTGKRSQVEGALRPRNTAQTSNNHMVSKYPLPQPEKIDKQKLKDFIILEKGDYHTNDENAFNILRQSASFSKVDFCSKYNVEVKDGINLQRCSLFFNDELFAEAMDETTTNAQVNASILALEKLRAFRPVIRVKETPNDRVTIIRRSEIFGDEDKINETISSDSVGSRLLRKMGWAGGALGKDTSYGRLEPIRLGAFTNRRNGLGYEKSSPETNADFLNTVRDLVDKFTKNTELDDLVFNEDFSEAEHNAIHKICRRYNLMVCHQDEGINHFLVVSHNRTAQELYRYLMQNGGSTNKFELIRPKGQYNKFKRY